MMLWYFCDKPWGQDAKLGLGRSTIWSAVQRFPSTSYFPYLSIFKTLYFWKYCSQIAFPSDRGWIQASCGSFTTRNIIEAEHLIILYTMMIWWWYVQFVNLGLLYICVHMMVNFSRKFRWCLIMLCNTRFIPHWKSVSVMNKREVHDWRFRA